MFKRFNPEARTVVVEALRQRSDLQHQLTGTEHLLLALLECEGQAGAALRRRGLTHVGMVDDLETVLATPRPDDETDADQNLLSRLGIDLDAVEAQAEHDFGPRALERARHAQTNHRRRNRRWFQRPWGRASAPAVGGFSPRAVEVFELSLQESLRLRSKNIGAEHLGLGLLREGQGLGCLLLAHRSISIEELTEDWEAISLASA